MIRFGDFSFTQVWAVDFEFSAPPGERPTTVCLVAWELVSGQKIRMWQDELEGMDGPPYAIDENTLFVAYYASAEIGCHLALNWPLPAYVLDLFAEFRCITNGLTLPCGAGLLGALTWYGLSGIDTVEKDSMRILAQRSGPWSATEKQSLLDYCESDVAALARLLPLMMPAINLPHAVLRGRYMKAAAVHRTQRDPH